MKEAIPLSKALALIEGEPVAAEVVADDTFRIDSESAATWLCRKLKAIEDERVAVKAATKKRVDQLNSAENSLRFLFWDQLMSWAMGERERRGLKTITLPLAGVNVAFRAFEGELVESDEGLQMRRDIATSMGFMTEEKVIEAEPDLERLLAYAMEQYAASPEDDRVIISGYEWKEAGETFNINYNPGGKAPATAPPG